MRRIFVLLSLLLPLSMVAQNEDWRGGYSEMEEETQTVDNFFNTKDNNKYWVVSLGYSSMFDNNGRGVYGYVGHGRNIACHKLPLYLEYGVRYAYSTFHCFDDDGAHTLGAPIYLTYKLKAKNFQLMPVTGPTFNAVDLTDDLRLSNNFGISWDLGFRIGYKKVNLEYRHSFDLKDFGEANFATLSFLW